MKERVVITSILILLILVTFSWFQSYGYFGGSDGTVLGNTVSNIRQGGYACGYKEKIYFANYGDQGKLYRMDADGGHVKKVADVQPKFMNILDGWIYFAELGDDQKLYKMRLDGSERQKLLDKSIDWSLLAYGDWLYFYSHEIGGGIYKIRQDGKKLTQVVKGAYHFNIEGEHMYYANFDGFYKANLTGHRRDVLYDNRKANQTAYDAGFKQSDTPIRIMNSIIVDKDKLYFTNVSYNGQGNFIYESDLDTIEPIQLTKEKVEGSNMTEDYIYYINQEDDNSLYRMRHEGTEQSKVIEGPVSHVNIVGQHIFYFRNVKKDLYRMDLEGNHVEQINGLDHLGNFDVSEGTLFYTKRYKGMNGKLFTYGPVMKMDMTNQEKEALTKEPAYLIKVEEDKVYVNLQKEPGDGRFNQGYSMDRDGKNLKKLDLKKEYKIGEWLIATERRENLDVGLYKKREGQTEKVWLDTDKYLEVDFIHGDYIYYRTTWSRGPFKDYVTKYYRIHVNGKDQKLLSHKSISNLIVVKDSIYYTNQENFRVYRMGLDGSHPKAVTEDGTDRYYIQGPYLYYGNRNDYKKLYRVSLDGQEKKKISNLRNTVYAKFDGPWIYYTYRDVTGKQYRNQLDGRNEIKLH